MLQGLAIVSSPEGWGVLGKREHLPIHRVANTWVSVEAPSNRTEQSAPICSFISSFPDVRPNSVTTSRNGEYFVLFKPRNVMLWLTVRNYSVPQNM